MTLKIAHGTSPHIFYDLAVAYQKNPNLYVPVYKVMQFTLV